MGDVGHFSLPQKSPSTPDVRPKPQWSGRLWHQCPSSASCTGVSTRRKERESLPAVQPTIPKSDGLLAACRTWGVDSENRPQRGHFLPFLCPIVPPMGQKKGEKWVAAVDLQPTIPKSDRLLVLHPHFDGQMRNLLLSLPRHACDLANDVLPPCKGCQSKF